MDIETAQGLSLEELNKYVVRCPECGSDKWTNAGKGKRKRKKNLQRRLCSECIKIYILNDDNPFAFYGIWESYITKLKNSKVKEIIDAKS